jgi:hypothetical protein
VLSITVFLRKEHNNSQREDVRLSDPRVVTMLAEIFMVRLEAAARALQEAAVSSNSRFVAFSPHSQFTFKESRDRVSEAVREEPTAQKVL